MEFFPRISSPFSEPWVAWTMVILLVLLILADRIQRGLATTAFRGLFSNKDRDSIFSESVSNRYGQIALLLYEIGITSLTLYVSMYQTGPFSFLTFLRICGIICAAAGIRYIIREVFAYIFLTPKEFRGAKYHYHILINVYTILLYPLILPMLFVPFMTPQTNTILLSVLALSALILWLIKAFRLFFTNILAGFYIFLYLCTLEILPILGVVSAVRLLVN